ncbi:MAG: type I secretion system permease/ATPase [Candidatus Cloacimonadota bacterium]|nr:MAG: type I secretion system permease/ATPase [Candidatus Cloacimonadota bacterium]
MKNQNTVFAALSLYCSLYQTSINQEVLEAGLARASNASAPDILSSEGQINNLQKAANKVGLITKFARRHLPQLPQAVYPLIAILKDNTACVIDRVENNEVYYLIPSSGDIITKRTMEEFYTFYDGIVCFVSDKNLSITNLRNTLKSDGTHWFWGTIKLSIPIYLDVLLASLIINIFVIASPLFTMNVYDRVVPNQAIDTLWVLAIGAGVIFLLDALLKFLRTWMLEVAAKKSDVLISSAMFAHVLDLNLEDGPKNIGSFTTNFREFDAVRNFLTSTVMTALVDLPFVGISLYVIYIIAGPLYIVPLVVMGLILIYAILIKTPLYNSIEDTFEAATLKSRVLIESLTGLKEIKMLGTAGVFQYRWEKLVAELSRKSMKSKLLTASVTTVTATLIQLNTIALVVYGVYQIQDLQLSMGGLIASVILSSRVIAPMGQVVSLLSNFDQTRVAYTAVAKIMECVGETASSKSFLDKNNIEGIIEFRDVSFTYPQEELPAIKELSFFIKKGERVAILGKTGSGKSTVEKLLLGFYQVSEGSILIDGIASKQIHPVVLRDNIAHVPQDSYLFFGTLKENISFKCPNANDAVLWNALEIAGIGDIVRDHPMGIEMMVAEGGSNLAGGVRQAVVIARAFVKNSPLILLDEPTNSMDTQMESKVRENLKKVSQDKTFILITHKVSMLSTVDRVIVLDKGKLVFDGDKDLMLKKFSSNV